MYTVKRKRTMGNLMTELFLVYPERNKEECNKQGGANPETSEK